MESRPTNVKLSSRAASRLAELRARRAEQEEDELFLQSSPRKQSSGSVVPAETTSTSGEAKLEHQAPANTTAELATSPRKHSDVTSLPSSPRKFSNTVTSPVETTPKPKTVSSSLNPKPAEPKTVSRLEPTVAPQTAPAHDKKAESVTSSPARRTSNTGNVSELRKQLDSAASTSPRKTVQSEQLPLATNPVPLSSTSPTKVASASARVFTSQPPRSPSQPPPAQAPRPPTQPPPTASRLSTQPPPNQNPPKTLPKTIRMSEPASLRMASLSTTSTPASVTSAASSADVTDDAGGYQSKYSKPMQFSKAGASYSSALPDSKDLTGKYKEYQADYASPSKWSNFSSINSAPRTQHEVRHQYLIIYLVAVAKLRSLSPSYVCKHNAL